LRVFVYEDKKETNLRYQTGKETINVTATAIVLEVLVKVLEEVNMDLT